MREAANACGITILVHATSEKDSCLLPACRGVSAGGGGGHAEVGGRRRRRVVQRRRESAVAARVAAKVRGRLLKKEKKEKIEDHLPSCSQNWHLTPATPITVSNANATQAHPLARELNYQSLLRVRNIIF